MKSASWKAYIRCAAMGMLAPLVFAMQADDRLEGLDVCANAEENIQYHRRRIHIHSSSSRWHFPVIEMFSQAKEAMGCDNWWFMPLTPDQIEYRAFYAAHNTPLTFTAK